MKLNITRNDCRGASRGSFWFCPAANALARKLLGQRNSFGVYVTVGCSMARLYSSSGVQLKAWTLPKKLIKAIDDYDDDKQFCIGVYELKRVRW